MENKKQVYLHGECIIKVSANNNGQVFQTVSTKKGNNRIKVKVNSKF